MYMYFLLAINDDFDDDLLFDAIGILAEIWMIEMGLIH